MIVLLGALGAAVGSFLNVVAYRLPRRESLIKPRSRCPQCDTPIAPYDNVPVLSWLALRGRCRSCRASIPIRYPIVEVLTAALFVLVGIAIGPEPRLLPGLVLTATVLAAAAIDLEHRIIPNRLTAAAAVAALPLWGIADPAQIPESLTGGVAAGAFMLVAALAYPAGMGMGDVKLAAVMGLYLGRSVAPALFAGFAAGALVGLAMVLLNGPQARKKGIPFGPFLALGGLVGLLAGQELIDWYLSTAGLSD